MSRSILSICPFIVAIGLAGPVVAGPATSSLGTVEDAQIHVQVAADDMANPTKARFTFARLQAAARAVCESDFGDPESLIAEGQCYKDALNEAVGATHSPVLVALNEGKVTQSQLAALTAEPAAQTAMDMAKTAGAEAVADPKDPGAPQAMIAASNVR